MLTKRLIAEKGFSAVAIEGDWPDASLLERAIGVVYRPDTERQSHYFHASLPEQFDGVLHIDRTRAIEPLERTAEWTRGEVPETFPMGV